MEASLISLPYTPLSTYSIDPTNRILTSIADIRLHIKHVYSAGKKYGACNLVHAHTHYTMCMWTHVYVRILYI